MQRRSFALLFFALLLAPARAQEPDPILRAALENYERVRSQPWFEGHTQARFSLAQTRSDAAWQLLVRDYRQPPMFDVHVRATIATMFGLCFTGDVWQERLQALRQRHDEPEDFWLWVTTLRPLLRAAPAGDVLARFRAERTEALRLAHVTALAQCTPATMFESVPPLLMQLPRRETERLRLLGAIACAMLRHGGSAQLDPQRTAIDAWIALLDREELRGPTERELVKRTLRLLLDVPHDYDEAEPWRELLKGSGAAATPGPTRTRPRFFGIESDGSRVAFVIDMSDSMARRFEHGNKGGPRTGRLARSAALDESDIDWRRVKNRYDLAREHLRITLLRLDPKVRFTVIWFGEKADTLSSTQGFVEASDQRVRAVLAELDAIGPRRTAEPGESERGLFRGYTNLHGGLRLAFELLPKGQRADEPVHDARLFEHGTDTIFVLSDGAPTWDDFDRAGTALHGYRAGGEFQSIPEGSPVTFCGPYRLNYWLLDDVQRMNSLRLVRVHCVGIGEADMVLLEVLARQNFGQSLQYGKR